MQGAIYLLCAATAWACAVLLFRACARRRVRLLLWCGLFFLMLAVENLVHFIDIILLPQVDLSWFRNVAALVGVSFLLYGLIWEVKK